MKYCVLFFVAISIIEFLPSALAAQDTRTTAVNMNLSDGGLDEISEAIVENAWSELTRVDEKEPPEKQEIVDALYSAGPEAIPTYFAMLAWAEGYGANTRAGQQIDSLSPYEFKEGASQNAPLQTRILLEVLLKMKQDGLIPFIQTMAYKDPLETSLGFRMTVARIVEEIAYTDQDILLHTIDKNSSLTPVLLPKLKIIQKKYPLGLSRRTKRVIYRRVRCLLNDRSWVMRQCAVRILGEMKDIESIPDIIPLLDDEHVRVRGFALGALQTMTGIKLPAKPELWTRWYNQELDWLDTELPQLAQKLLSNAESEAIKSIRILSQKRVFIDQIAQELAVTVEHSNANVRRAGCIALQQIGSMTGIPALLNALYDEDESVRRIAWNALKALTTQDLPQDPDVWESWYERQDT